VLPILLFWWYLVTTWLWW